MSQADWSIALGVLIFIIAVVVAIVYYYRFKKLYPVVFVSSISTYIFSVFYLWDVYDLDKNLVMLLLVVSTILMFFLGKYFKNIDLKPSKVHTSLKEK